MTQDELEVAQAIAVETAMTAARRGAAVALQLAAARVEVLSVGGDDPQVRAGAEAMREAVVRVLRAQASAFRHGTPV